ncbi:outer membrane lipoprotein carrier protein LolA [Yinghuangia aomiensis]|uniref:Outer membrane lipoprotein carrier protein LolA n=1 Tax=Yinghuangia aomiensis TaxID=676205 RepID=A0ABP9HZQ2_9ACTN
MPVVLRTAGKVALPLGVTALAAGAITYGPAAFADDSDPKLPVLTADQVVAKIAGATNETLSGTVDLTTDLGLPALPGRGSADPSGLVSGTHTLRVAVDGPDRQRIGIRADLAEYNIVHNGRDVWTYDSRRNAATHTLLPEQQAGQAGQTGQAKEPGTALPGAAITPQDAAAKLLDLAKQSGTTVTAAGTDKVAGRSAYKLRLAPAQPGSLLAGATVWADAETGVPLRVVVDTAKGGKPALDVGFTDVSFAKPAAGTFDFKPPSGAKVDEKNTAADDAAKNAKEPFDLTKLTAGFRGTEPKTHGEGWNTVVELRLPAGVSAKPSAPQPQAGGKDQTKDTKEAKKDRPGIADLLSKAGSRVSGPWGEGTLFSTRVATVLVTDDGRVFAGAVDGATLQQAAGTAAR